MWMWVCLLTLTWEAMRVVAMTPAERAEILEIHTRTRESVHPPASNMQMMVRCSYFAYLILHSPHAYSLKYSLLTTEVNHYNVLHPIPKQRYSLDMEELAEDWLNHCLFSHPDPLVYPQFKGVGQNLAIVGGYTPSIKLMTQGWIDEGKHYHYRQQKCSTVTCLHYTQVILSILLLNNIFNTKIMRQIG